MKKVVWFLIPSATPDRVSMWDPAEEMRCSWCNSKSFKSKNWKKEKLREVDQTCSLAVSCGSCFAHLTRGTARVNIYEMNETLRFANGTKCAIVDTDDPV